MDYQLKVKKKSQPTFSIVDLFPDTLISFNLDFYDVDNIDKIKVPVSVDMSLPMTENNISIIDYDPQSNVYTTVPTSPFDFELYLNGNKVLEGNLYIESYAFNNALPVLSIRLVDRLQEIFSDIKSVTLDTMYSDYNSLTSFDSLMSAYEGVIGTAPTKSDIVLPYIDFCNDTEKFGFASRQFIQFGFDKDRVGIVPAFKVNSFLERFFNEAGVGVTSRFFQLGSYGTVISNTDPESMYMVLPTKLQASSRTRTRGFYLVEGPYEYTRNEFTKDLTQSQSNAREIDSYPYTSFGWNYAPSPNANPSYGDYGLTYQTNVPNTGEDIDKAYFGSHMSYTASPPGTARTLPTGSFVDFEIPMITLNPNSFAIVQSIDGDNSTAVFNIKATLWVDGEPKHEFRMCNTDGSIKELTISNANIFSNENLNLFEVNNGGSWGSIFEGDAQYPRSYDNRVRFTNSQIGSFIWEQKQIEIEAGSTYAVSIGIEVLSGNINLDYVDTWGPDPNLSGDYDYISTTNRLVKDADITKIIMREDASNIGNLYVALTSAGNGSHNPYFGDDDVNLIWGLQDSNVSPYEVVREIVKRFNLSVVYDQANNSVVIDRLPDLRSTNTSTDITSKVDNAEQITVDVVTKLAKSLQISTSASDLYYDKYGYNTIELNGAGSDELKFELSSRFYNTSVCGDETFVEIPDGFSEYEIGFTINEFTKYNEIGIVFGYLDSPNYTTNIRRGKFVSVGNTKTLIYDVYGSHVFPRLVSSKTGAMPLNHFDELGNATALFNFFIGNDNVQFYAKPTVKFNALFDSDYAFNIKDNYSVVQMDYINSNQIVIKSFSGDMYDGGLYGEVEAIIL